ncbi:hypothetical protein BKK54_06315 [Rodentibacter genomosp. 1]|uniref:Phage tail protein n=1 Tax=Rodentibacter genomosp. 1 TaxID=1908264 RepID=A0A1V3J5D5_9PAST|nr:tail fiber protein [Rodentibacter genomosp. 1]OOF50257.1 hypothetical protein BKK54_06315 [Rodentibacter genomosp. 1]
MKTLLPEINSADKRFHNGNPATGEQGTRVTDTWLNDVQDRVRDVQAEAHYVLQRAGFKPKAETQTQLYQAILKIIEDNRLSAGISQKGEVQLTNNYNGESEVLGLTQKAGKALKALIDSLTRNLANYIPNSKKSNAVDSASSDTVATSAAVKAVNDKVTPLNFYKVNVKAGGVAVTFDLSIKAHWIAEIGSVYKGTGYYQLGLHNNAISTITNLPLNDKSPVQLDIAVMGAYSLIHCHYIYLNRTFTARADWNRDTFPLSWYEEVKLNAEGKVPRDTVFARSLESNYRVVIRRNEARFTPYMHMIDQSVDMAADSVQQKGIAEIISRAGEGDSVPKSMLKTILLADKNITFEIGAWNSAQQYKYFLKGFTATNNVVIGSGTDNTRDLLQVSGTIKATAPADNANNDQVPNTFWVRRFVSNTVNAAKEWVKSHWENKLLTHEDLNNITTPGAYGQNGNSNATPERHYPEPIAGSLLVTKSAYGVQQEYTLYQHNRHRKYVRNKTQNGWTAWQRVDGLDNVNKSGDTMTGKLIIEDEADGHHGNAGIALINKGSRIGTAVHYDACFQANKINKGGIHINATANGGATASILVTPDGDKNQDRRITGFRVNQDGTLWSHYYGLLHEFFIKRTDFIRTYYPQHYAGAEVYKIRHLGLMITIMQTTFANRELILPESYDGFGVVFAVDRGNGGVGVARGQFLGGNRINIGGRGDTHCNVLVIGFKNV